MKFHLDYKLNPSPAKISHHEKILMMGSCFAGYIGEYLTNYKFNCEINPNGILFNPVSISEALNSYIHHSFENSIVKNNDLFFSMNHHGDFAFKKKDELTQKIKTIVQKGSRFLKETDWLIITFGSAFAYRYLKTGEIVANCHKLPQNEFKKELLSPEEIISGYLDVLKDLKKLNPKLKIIFTVSPVKYLRDGLIENSLSKSILIHSVHRIICQTDNCFYFPAYELVTDDLRDYRFYKEDLVHPNELGIKYVLEKFETVFFNDETMKLNDAIAEISVAVQHKPIHPESENNLKFKTKYLKKCKALEKEFNFLNFGKEKACFSV